MKIQKKAGEQKKQTKEHSDLKETAKSNKTGLPEHLKAGVEGLSGYSLDDVKVHYNSGRPAPLGALAYTQGANIYVGPGQEKYLPHEAWHVVQQKQGRVTQTTEVKGVGVNDNKALEYEADKMGNRSLNVSTQRDKEVKKATNYLNTPLQRAGDFGNLMPEHETLEPPTYAYKNNPQSTAYTYHHIIPENILKNFYNNNKARINASEEANDTRGSIKASWINTRVENLKHFWNKKFGQRFLTPPALQGLRVYLNGNFDFYMGVTQDNFKRDNAVIYNLMKQIANGGVVDAQAENRVVADVDEVIEDSELLGGYGGEYRDEKEREEGETEQTKKEKDDKASQLKAGICWIPGNLIQGPLSNDRLKGKGTDIWESDGEEDFEYAAVNIMPKEQFEKLYQLYQIIIKPAAQLNQEEIDQALQYINDLTTHYQVTKFRETADKWDTTGEKIKVRRDENKIGAFLISHIETDYVRTVLHTLKAGDLNNVNEGLDKDQSKQNGSGQWKKIVLKLPNNMLKEFPRTVPFPMDDFPTTLAGLRIAYVKKQMETGILETMKQAKWK